MKKFSLSFAFSQSFSQIAKTFVMSLTSVVVLAGCMLVLGTMGLLQYNVDANLADLSSDREVVVFLQTDCTDSEISQVQTLLDTYRKDGLLKQYTYVSKEEALEAEMDKFEEYPLLFQSIQTGENPYRASFTVRVDKESDIQTLTERLEGVTLTRTDKSGEAKPFLPIANLVSHSKAIETIDGLMGTVRSTTLGLSTVLLLLGVFVMVNTIRLAIFSRRQELAVMRYVGATRSFMVAPFMMQGLVLGFFSAIAAFVFQWFFYGKMTAYLAEHYQMVDFATFDTVWYYLLASFLFAGLLVGAVCGLLSTGRYLKDKE